MHWLFYFIPAFVIVIFFAIATFINNASENILGDPQDIVGRVCKIEYDVNEKIDSILVRFEDGKHKVLKLSTFKGNVEKKTRVLIVKYEPDTGSYKIERYE